MGIEHHVLPYKDMLSPSSTADTIEAKLSSRRIMSETCLATSVPVMFMAMPGQIYITLSYRNPMYIEI